MEIKIPTTAVDIYRMLPEGTRCEVIFNELSMSPSPSFEHQNLSMLLSGLFFNFLLENPIGKVVAAPIDVYLENFDSVVQPDFILILEDNSRIINSDGIHGTPDLIIEILSSNYKHDTIKKKALYEKAGVKEYFIIDPIEKMVTKYFLNPAGEYELIYNEKGKINSSLLNHTFNI
jgi:Uma2 family endonuclease